MYIIVLSIIVRKVKLIKRTITGMHTSGRGACCRKKAPPKKWLHYFHAVGLSECDKFDGSRRSPKRARADEREFRRRRELRRRR